MKIKSLKTAKTTVRSASFTSPAFVLAACHSGGTEDEQSLFDIPDNYALALRGNGTSISSGALGLDSALNVTLVSGPSNGTATPRQDGTIDYTPNTGYSGNDQVTVEISDGQGGSEVVTINLDIGGTIGPVGDAPLAADDKASVVEDGQFSIIAKYGVLSNDFDESDMTATLLTGPDHGTVVLNADGSYTYTPDPDYHGQDQFTYTVTDEDGDTDTGQVNLLVTPVNDDPVASDLSVSVNRETIIFSQLPANDVDGDTLTFTLLQGPSNGQVTVYPGGQFHYTGDKFFWGTDTFTYTVDDGNGGVDTATVTVEVLPNIPSFGTQFNGVSNNDLSGRQVSNLGDVNGDGRDDFIINAMNGDNNGGNSGESYVVFGSSSFAPSFDLASLNGSNGFVINGINGGDRAGEFVSSAGDINNDGYDDILIGAWRADPNNNTGDAYIVFGGPTFAASLDLSTLNGTNGFRIDALSNGDRFGYSVSDLGDINGDGIDDFMVGAPRGDGPAGQPNTQGETFVIFGTTTPFGSTFDLSTLNGSNGFRVDGISGGDQSGFSISGGGDINGDGFNDLLIGTLNGDPNGTSNAGESYVVFGRDTGFNPIFNLSGLNGSNGFTLNGINVNDRAGREVKIIGDFNGDGRDDLVIGAWQADPNGADSGEAYVVFGFDDTAVDTVELSALTGQDGFVIQGNTAGDDLGFNLAGAGDVNGDGYADLLIGERQEGNGPGEVYLILGTNSTFSSPFDPTTLDGTNGFIFTGLSNLDRLGWGMSSAGDVNGDGFDDFILGAQRGDTGGNNRGETYLIYGGECQLELYDLIDGQQDGMIDLSLLATPPVL